MSVIATDVARAVACTNDCGSILRNLAAFLLIAGRKHARLTRPAPISATIAVTIRMACARERGSIRALSTVVGSTVDVISIDGSATAAIVNNMATKPVAPARMIQ